MKASAKQDEPGDILSNLDSCNRIWGV